MLADADAKFDDGLLGGNGSGSGSSGCITLACWQVVGFTAGF